MGEEVHFSLLPCAHKINTLVLVPLCSISFSREVAFAGGGGEKINDRFARIPQNDPSNTSNHWVDADGDPGRE